MVYFIMVDAEVIIVAFGVPCPPEQNGIARPYHTQWKMGMKLFLHQCNTFSPILHFTGPDDTYTESYAEVAQERSN